jgi:hypothetical protein
VSVNFGRYCSITFDGSVGTLDVSSLRCRFTIKQHTLQLPNTATIRITNQLPATARQLAQTISEYKTVTITAGYQSNFGVVFSGNIVQGIYGRESATDTMTTVFASDGDQAHNFAVVNKTLAAGSTPKDHVDAAVAAMGKYGVTMGPVGSSVDLSTPQYPRAVALFGMARDVLANVAKSKGASVSYQNGQVQIMGTGDSAPGDTTVLNTLTGLIGMPAMSTGGVYARILINPAVKMNSLVRIDQSLIQGMQLPLGPNGQLAPTPIDVPNIAADGVYRVFRVDADGDTRGNPWYMDLGCLVPGQQTSSSIASSART